MSFSAKLRLKCRERQSRVNHEQLVVAHETARRNVERAEVGQVDSSRTSRYWRFAFSHVDLIADKVGAALRQIADVGAIGFSFISSIDGCRRLPKLR